MTKLELIDRLKKIKRDFYSDTTMGDPEASHVETDKALLKYINDKKVTKLHDLLAPWYA